MMLGNSESEEPTSDDLARGGLQSAQAVLCVLGQHDILEMHIWGDEGCRLEIWCCTCEVLLGTS